MPSQRQKLGIIRGPDGKITSVTGLQPGQKLIESPTGLRIITTSTPNRPDRKVIVKSELPKTVSKVANAQESTESGQQKAPVVVRQQVGGNAPNVIVKTVANKTATSNTPVSRSVVLNSGQVLGEFNINYYLFTVIQDSQRTE